MKLKIISIAIGLVLVSIIAVFGNLCRVREVDVVFTEELSSDDADAVYAALEIETGASIIGVNENDFKRRIYAAYPDRSYIVTNVIRTFPDKVTVYVDVNKPLFAVPLMDGTGYALADKDFQLNMKVSESELNKSSLIIVSAVSVGNSFNLPVFAALREAFYGLSDAASCDEAAVALISEIAVEGEYFVFKTRTCDAFRVFASPVETLRERSADALEEYFSAAN